MGCKISVKADPTTWTVDDGEADFSSIQEAINSPDVKDGDTIFVYNGTYYEHVVVNKSVSLVGEDRDLTIVDGNRTGSVISIRRTNNVNISGFTVRRSGLYSYYDSGIHVDHSSGIYISHNTITNNYGGISLDSSFSNVFSGNTISSNDYDGISLDSSSSNVFLGNTISSNNDGISLFLSFSNVFLGNTISSNDYDGISLYSSSSNVFSGNTISSNDNYGISLHGSNNNTIFCNNFNNKNQVWSDSMNVWDDEDEGNYWSDYTGTDADQDGIGDTPYKIDENNQDNRPLMGIFSDFSVIHQEETYHVTAICNSTISDFRFEIGSETGNEIIRFNVTGKDGTVGFCRVMIPTELMNYPYIVLVDAEEIVPILLDVSNETYVCLYFTYIHSSHTITIISSKTLHLYSELLDKYVKLQTDLYDLNVTYHGLLNNYSILLGNYSELLDKYVKLQTDLYDLNVTYHGLLSNYGFLLGNYSQLQKSHQELNNSYQEHLLDYSKNVHNIRNLTYIFAATTAIFIIATIYLSKRAHVGKTKVLLRAQQHKSSWINGQ